MRYPPPLQPGDTIAVVAPASAPPMEEATQGIQALSKAGFRIKTYRDSWHPNGYLAGTDEQRAQELSLALADPEVRMVLAVRGGYGVTRILDRVDFSPLARNPKLLAGYSDLTALHAAVRSKCDLMSLHSPNALDWRSGPGGLDADSRASFLACAARPHGLKPHDLATAGADSACRTLVSGTMHGILTGGNLAVLVGLIGTSLDFDPRDKVLVLEDDGEAPYRIDRMFSQLQLAGKFRGLSGVVLGHFTNCTPSPGKESLTLDDIFEHYLGPLRISVLAGYPVGHTLPNLTLPLGAEAILRTP